MTINKIYDNLQELEAERTSRHLLLPGFTNEHQQLLRDAKICMVGAGGLGSPCLLSLAAAGVGEITICDDDVVELSNLQRQTLYTVDQCGKFKAQLAANRLQALSPGLKINLVNRFNEDNAKQLVENHDLIIDGCDNFATRFLIADAAWSAGTPEVYGSVLYYEGQVSVFVPGKGPGLRDLYACPPPKEKVPKSAVLGATAAIVGAMMATEAIKLITGIGTPLIGVLARYNALDNSLRRFKFSA